jgi:hypothetical protein
MSLANTLTTASTSIWRIDDNHPSSLLEAPNHFGLDLHHPATTVWPNFDLWTMTHPYQRSWFHVDTKIELYLHHRSTSEHTDARLSTFQWYGRRQVRAAILVERIIDIAIQHAWSIQRATTPMLIPFLQNNWFFLIVLARGCGGEIVDDGQTVSARGFSPAYYSITKSSSSKALCNKKTNNKTNNSQKKIWHQCCVLCSALDCTLGARP